MFAGCGCRGQRTLAAAAAAADKSLRPGERREKIRGGLPGIVTPVTHLVEDGELFGSLRCISTPGHIPGHFAFLDERDGTLFCGDALVNVGGLSVSGVWRTVFPFPYFATCHRPSACASARRLLALAPTTLACVHGRPIPAPAEALTRAIAEAEGSTRASSNPLL